LICESVFVIITPKHLNESTGKGGTQMAPIAAQTYLTPEAYLELERKGTIKNEY